MEYDKFYGVAVQLLPRICYPYVLFFFFFGPLYLLCSYGFSNKVQELTEIARCAWGSMFCI